MMQSWKEHFWYTVPIMRKRIETIVDLCQPQGKSIIEVGCNEGFLSKALLENGAGRVVPIDKSAEMCNKANEIFGVDAIEGDINSLKFSDQSFDIALGCEVLEHIANPMQGLNELFRVAREKVIVSVPVGEYWAGELTHQWMLSGFFINHDNVSIYQADKDILIICFKRIRDNSFIDILPFDTGKLKEKYAIK